MVKGDRASKRYSRHRAGRTCVSMMSTAFAAILSASMLTGCGGNRPASTTTGENGTGSTDDIAAMIDRDSGERYASSLDEYVTQLLDRLDTDDQLAAIDPDGSETAHKRKVLQRVLAEGEMDVGEYESAWGGYRECLAGLGTQANLIKLPNGLYVEGGYRLGSDGVTVDEEDRMNCGILHTSYIDEVYRMQQGNPNLYLNPYEGALDCMRRGNLVPKGYTVDDLGHDLYEATGPQDLTVDVYDAQIAACLVANNIHVVPDGSPLVDM